MWKISADALTSGAKMGMIRPTVPPLRTGNLQVLLEVRDSCTGMTK
jgi:hypothetical protein